MFARKSVADRLSAFHAQLAIAALAAVFGMLVTGPASAQAGPVPQANVGLPDVPTTKILAIGSIAPSVSRAGLPSIMTDEVRDTVRLYLDGRIEQWFVRKDRPGVVFILRAGDLNEARATLDALPLCKAGLMTFEIIPLGPLSPLGMLIAPKPR